MGDDTPGFHPQPGTAIEIPHSPTPPPPPSLASLSSAAARARDAALEEAAQIVETGKDCHDLYAIAALIRARKDQP